MGQDYYSCECCGESFGDYGDYRCCECGNFWCSDECADNDGYIIYTEEEYEGEIPLDKNGYELESSCKYCRNEDFTDSQLLNYILKANNKTREQIVEEYREMITQ